MCTYGRVPLMHDSVGTRNASPCHLSTKVPREGPNKGTLRGGLTNSPKEGRKK